MLNYAKIGAIINFNMGDCKAETVETAIYATVPVPKIASFNTFSEGKPLS